jgi:isoleucyl-tRNA synthetase
MSDTIATTLDYSKTLYLPETGFPMRAGLPAKEPEILKYWEQIGLYGLLRAQSAGRPRFVLHDGPPYANGNIHIGHALNKILKDMVTRSQQALGFDSNYVPGWDCHGLPIEWKIEEEYRAKGKNKDDVPVVEFRQECRAFAEKWIGIQREEFKRLGVIGDWDNFYSTMKFPAEAQIAREIMKFAENGLLYRGSKPVMWSVVEKTALAEAEVEYEDYQSDTVYVAFSVTAGDASVKSARVVIWTTTPWTMPGNRAISFSNRIAYGLYEVTEAPEGNWAKAGETYILADKLASDVFKAAKVTAFQRVRDVPANQLGGLVCAHPLAGHMQGYDFKVPLLDGDHVTDDAGTGFVHTAPGHGREDFDIWTSSTRRLQEQGIDPSIPYTVDADGRFTKDAPGFEGRQVITDKGDKGDANPAVIDALAKSGNLIGRGRLKHQYPHSWRSKKPVIFRNTPQWFIAMDQPIPPGNASLRQTALTAISNTQWVPESGENRINGMIENRPDWVVSRQRAWGVPITVFVDKASGKTLVDARVNAAIADAFMTEGADAWFSSPDGGRFLTPFGYDPAQFEKVTDVLDVWFDSGSTHTYTLEDPVEFPSLAGTRRKVDGGADTVMYLEGSDQHRGWFHSSLLESCGTRGRAPFDVVLTHGFVLDEKGQKMSKSVGNVVAPQTVMAKSGADILRLWVAASDYSDDLRIGDNVLKGFEDTYRKLRNTIRWMLGVLAHHHADETVAHRDMPELERFMLHKLAELDPVIRRAYADYDYKRVVSALTLFMNVDLSAFYFDIRKDTLYCDPPSSVKRKAALTVVDILCDAMLVYLAPILSFTTEEAWLARGKGGTSVHLQTFPMPAADWTDAELAKRWAVIRNVRAAVTGALEIERSQKRIGSSLEAAPTVHVKMEPWAIAALRGVDFAEVCIVSDIAIIEGEGPADAFRLPDLAHVAVVPARAAGVKCARSWRYFDPATADPAWPDVSPRDAAALTELKALGKLPA